MSPESHSARFLFSSKVTAILGGPGWNFNDELACFRPSQDSTTVCETECANPQHCTRCWRIQVQVRLGLCSRDAQSERAAGRGTRAQGRTWGLEGRCTGRATACGAGGGEARVPAGRESGGRQASRRDTRDQSTYSCGSSAAGLSLRCGDAVAGPGTQVCPGAAGSLCAGSRLPSNGEQRPFPCLLPSVHLISLNSIQAQDVWLEAQGHCLLFTSSLFLR